MIIIIDTNNSFSSSSQITVDPGTVTPYHIFHKTNHVLQNTRDGHVMLF